MARSCICRSACRRRDRSMVYVPQEHRRQVEQFVANYRRTRQLLDEVAAINFELLRRREPID